VISSSNTTSSSATIVPVRFYAESNQSGLELGKLESAIGAILCPLLISRVLVATGTVVFAPDSLYPGAQIILDVSLTLDEQRLLRLQRADDEELPTDVDRSFFALLKKLGLISIDGGSDVDNTAGKVRLERFNLDNFLSENELKILELPEFEVTTDLLACDLRSYQKQALGWMIRREGDRSKSADGVKENRLCFLCECLYFACFS
jgi:hypothetical protein